MEDCVKNKIWMKDHFLFLNTDFGPKSAHDKVADFILKHLIATVKDLGIFCMVYHLILISKTAQSFEKQSQNRTYANPI